MYRGTYGWMGVCNDQFASRVKLLWKEHAQCLLCCGWLLLASRLIGVL